MANKDNQIYLIGAAALGLLMVAGKRNRVGVSGTWPPRNLIWPLSHHREPKVYTSGAKSFSADRGGGRSHAGIDLPASEGTAVVAPEGGTIVATQGWDGARAKAILMETDSGVVILFGAVAPNSWKEFGLAKGSRVKRGQGVARIGVYPAGSTMLHLEMYTKGTTKNSRWFPPNYPQNLINPTEYLQAASRYVLV